MMPVVSARTTPFFIDMRVKIHRAQCIAILCQVHTVRNYFRKLVKVYQVFKVVFLTEGGFFLFLLPQNVAHEVQRADDAINNQSCSSQKQDRVLFCPDASSNEVWYQVLEGTRCPLHGCVCQPSALLAAARTRG